MQLSFPEEAIIPQLEIKKKGGPPNNMNDLRYKDWMKFQKSFFWFDSYSKLINEFVPFFTKEKEGNIYTTSLLINFNELEIEQIQVGHRIIQSKVLEIEKLENYFQELLKGHFRYDFILINALNISLQAINNFLIPSMSVVSELLKENKYVSILTSSEDMTLTSFPIPWLVSEKVRFFLKLRDEKIALVNQENKLFFSLVFQNKQEIYNSEFDISKINTQQSQLNIPVWLFPKSPPRKKNEKLHPAKFPETLIEEFIRIFSSKGDNVFDPMVGTGSTIIASINLHRNGIGCDISPDFVQTTKDRIERYAPPSLFARSTSNVFLCDANELSTNNYFKSCKIDYCITSPPYWSMLRNKGSEYQRGRRNEGLPTHYSDTEHDIGNILNYNEFIHVLSNIYFQIYTRLKPGGYLTVIVKNVKRDQTIYPLAWDIVSSLSIQDKYKFLGYTLWCQDDIPIRPFALGAHWISHTVHNYCLHFQK